MTYAAMIVGPAGRITYLCRGREVERPENATAYAHPSAARRAIDAYWLKTPGIFGRVVKPSDPEWQE